VLRGGLAIAALALAGCASAPVNLHNMSPELWTQEVARRGVDTARVHNPLLVNEAMREEALRLARTGGDIERLQRLQAALFNGEEFPFRYDNRRTLTAIEAYTEREGNCLSFTNLFVALARSLGIPATTALVLRVRGSEREGDLIVVNTHVVAVYQQAAQVTFYDFDQYRDRRPTAVRPLDDLWIAALYLNNRGSDELRVGRPDLALALFEDAVRLAPDFAGAWGNLGVARRRGGNISGAFAAYEQALTVDPDNPTVLSNLAALYSSLGKEREARQALSVASVTDASPHSLLVRGDLELAQGRPKQALSFYGRARRLDPKLGEAWLACARAALALGREGSARRYVGKALDCTPGLVEAQQFAARLGVAVPAS
jgi:Flp pilus assembly protein TadD